MKWREFSRFPFSRRCPVRRCRDLEARRCWTEQDPGRYRLHQAKGEHHSPGRTDRVPPQGQGHHPVWAPHPYPATSRPSINHRHSTTTQPDTSGNVTSSSTLGFDLTYDLDLDLIILFLNSLEPFSERRWKLNTTAEQLLKCKNFRNNLNSNFKQKIIFAIVVVVGIPLVVT